MHGKRSLSFALVIVAFALWGARARAVDGVYVGAQVGNVSFTGNSGLGSAIGFGGDLGLRANPLLDVVYHLQYSSHSGGLAGVKLWSNTLTADFHVLQVNDFDFAILGGPGFYTFSFPGTSQTNFGLNFGANGDVVFDESLRVGIGFRYHVVMGDNTSNYWTLMARAGYLFNL